MVCWVIAASVARSLILFTKVVFWEHCIKRLMSKLILQNTVLLRARREAF
jgi:hypothetical protein